MNVALDLLPVRSGASGGVFKLLRGVLGHLLSRYHEHAWHVFYHRDEAPFLPEGGHIHSHLLHPARYARELVAICDSRRVEVLFRAFPTTGSLLFPLARQVVLIPDLQHEAFPQFFPHRVLNDRLLSFRQAQAGAGAIGTLSEFCRATLRAHPWTRCQDIFLMPPALDDPHPEPEGEPGPEESAGIPAAPYFFYPAHLWPHKNHGTLFAALARYRQWTASAAELVLTGDPEGWEALRHHARDLPVRHLGYVSPRMVAALMRRARALCFFSLYEGFGIPLLEAFQAGTPVICSNTTALPETGGDAVRACNPADPRQIAALMKEIDEDQALRSELVARGRKRLAQFRCERSAQELLAALGRVAARTHTFNQLAEGAREA